MTVTRPKPFAHSDDYMLHELSSMLNRGQWKVATRRYLVLRAYRIEVPEPHRSRCEGLLRSCPPRDLGKIKNSVLEWCVLSTRACTLRVEQL